MGRGAAFGTGGRPSPRPFRASGPEARAAHRDREGDACPAGRAGAGSRWPGRGSPPMVPRAASAFADGDPTRRGSPSSAAAAPFPAAARRCATSRRASPARRPRPASPPGSGRPASGLIGLTQHPGAAVAASLVAGLSLLPWEVAAAPGERRGFRASMRRGVMAAILAPAFAVPLPAIGVGLRAPGARWDGRGPRPCGVGGRHAQPRDRAGAGRQPRAGERLTDVRRHAHRAATWGFPPPSLGPPRRRSRTTASAAGALSPVGAAQAPLRPGPITSSGRGFTAGAGDPLRLSGVGGMRP